MTEESRFSKESFIYVFGEALSKSLTFILLPIYTSYLSVEDFAVLGIVTILWPIVVIFLGQGFSSYLIRGYFEYPD
jgi:O-antigen/teichoic acid export membrane protein